jgi:hypothetical protein
MNRDCSAIARRRRKIEQSGLEEIDEREKQ